MDMEQIYLLFVFLAVCQSSNILAADGVNNDNDIIFKKSEPLAVKRGADSVISKENLEVFSNDSIVCRIETINDPICLRFGVLSTKRFACNFASQNVLYKHSGSLISNEDCIKLKLLLFYEDRAVTKTVKIHVLVKHLEINERLLKPILITERIGGKVSFGKELFPPFIRNHSSSCWVTYFPESGWPSIGTVAPGTIDSVHTWKCSDFKATYAHDGSYIPNVDYIFFTLSWKDKSGIHKEIRYSLKIHIKEAQTNEPPVLQSRRPRLIVKQYSVTQLKTTHMRAIDYKTQPSKLLLKIAKQSRGSLGGYFATIENPDLPLEGITQAMIEKGKVVFVAPKTYSNKRRRLAIQQFSVQAIDPYGAVSSRTLRLLFFVRRFVAHYLSVVKNQPLHVLEGNSCQLTRNNLEIACPGSNCDYTSFMVIEDSKNGGLFRESKRINQFSFTDLNSGSITYRHDDSEILFDNIVISVTDRNQLALATINIVVEPVDDSPPFLSIHKELLVKAGQFSRIEPGLLQASDPDSSKSDIIFIETAKPKKGKIMRINGRGVFMSVSNFTETELGNGRIYFKEISKEPAFDDFSFILSDKVPNLSKEFFVRVKILASDKNPPYRRHKGECLVEMKETSASIPMSFIDYVDNFSSSADITVKLQRNHKGIDDDVTYVSNEDIVKIVGYKRIVVNECTQQELFHKKILLINRFTEVGIYSKNLQIDFVVSDAVNNTTPIQSCKIIVLPVDNKPPIVSAREGLNVFEGSRMCINGSAFDLSDEDTTINKLTISLTSLPIHGTLVFKGKNMTKEKKIDYLELRHRCLWYYHSGSETTRDSLSISASDGINIGHGYISITIIPVNDQRPSFVKETANINVMENSSIVIDSKLFKAVDADSSSSMFSYFVTRKPLKGKITKNSVNVMKFMQSDLDDDLLLYSHSAKEIGPYPEYDTITVFICDNSTFLKDCSSNIKIKFKIIPVNSMAPYLIRGKELVVKEGDKVAIETKNMGCYDKDTLEDSIYIRIFAFPTQGFLENIAPKEGSEESNAGKRITEFKCSDIRKRTVFYVQSNHTSFEPILDKISFIAFDGEFNSTPVAMHIEIMPVNDEPPVVDQIKAIEVQEGGWKMINHRHIRIIDRDIPKDTLKFFVSRQAKHGHLFYKCNGAGSPRLQKLMMRQKLDYRNCAMVYVHDDSETRADTFLIEATDGKMTSKMTAKILVIGINDQSPKVLNNIVMTVRLGGIKNITRSYLAAQDLDTNDNELTYKIIKLPGYGSLRLYNKGKPVKLFVNSTFTQEDINEKRLSYINHIMPITGLTDTFKFMLSDGVHVIKNRTFSLRIRLSCRKSFKIKTKNVFLNAPKVFITTKSLRVHLRKGKQKARDTREKTNEKDMVFHIIKQPAYGVLNLAPALAGGKVTAITQRDLQENRLTYRAYEYPLSKNDSLKFFVTDGKCMQRGRLDIIAKGLNAKVKLMKRVAALNISRRGVTTITPLEIRALKKFNPKKVVYSTESLPGNGIILKDGIVASNFSQTDINELRVTYRLLNENAKKDLAGIKVIVNDFYGLNLSTKAERFSLKINVKIPNMSRIRVITNQAITSLTNTGSHGIGAVVSNRNLLSYNCLSKLDVSLRYIVVEPPVHGDLIFKNSGRQATNFSQADINDERVIYKLTDYTHTEFSDLLILDVEGHNCKKLTGVEFRINWSVISLSDEVDVSCKNGQTAITLNLTRLGYLSQGAVVELQAKSLVDASQRLPSTRLWFHPGDQRQSWKLPEEALEYEEVEVYIDKEFNTLLGRAKVKFAISDLQDACSLRRKKNKKDSTSVKATTSISPGLKDSKQFHAISLIRTSSDKQKKRFKAAYRYKRKSFQPTGKCEKDWIRFTDNCYLMVMLKMNWKNALKFCKKRNSLLYTPTSSPESNAVKPIRKQHPIWIGIKKNKKGLWKSNVKKLERSSRRKLQILKASRHTNNACVYMDISGQWKLANCKQKVAYFVCKRPRI